MQVDHAANAPFDVHGLGALGDRRPGNHFGRNRVQLECARIVTVGILAARVGQGRAAVDGRAHIAWAQAAYGHPVAFAGFTLKQDPGNALQRLGDVVVRKQANIFRGDGVNHDIRLALDFRRTIETALDARDDDFLEHPHVRDRVMLKKVYA